ncbi:SagB family peptide dehydrogenase [Streptomyces sp. NPDC051320]|uniref:SagB family peptide dehydrogenase n=1 Tax=Streptomyces sp. NPDC051320 TaxID=3154644 RepID=UPI003418BB4C
MERVLLTGPAPAPGPAPVPASVAAARTVLGLRSDAVLTVTDEALVVTGPLCVLRLRELPASVRAVVADLAAGEHTEEDLGAAVVAGDGLPALLRLHVTLRRLDAEGLLDHTLTAGGLPLVRLRPVGRGRTELPPAPAADTPVKLSRFALAQVQDGRLTVAAPGSHLRVELAPAAAALLGALADWTTPAGIGTLPGLPEAGQALRLFGAAGLLAAGGPGDDTESQEPSQALWEPSDLWLHARSRGPMTVTEYGGTYPGAGRFEPLPAVPPARSTRTVALPVPDLAAVARQDPSLTEALESRRSVREHDDAAPITDVQLGELLYRAARCRQTFTGSDGQELADRPYPSGGAVHELEIYPLISHCAGLDPGLWHYRTDRHALERVAEAGPATAALVRGAREGALMESDPQIVLLVAARFGRVMWKYRTVSYPLLLKHVGVFYQTVYLIGAAMGLGVCGLGGGDAADFAAATGLDPRTEGSVGELVLGSRPAVLRHPSGVPVIQGRGSDGPVIAGPDIEGEERP